MADDIVTILRDWGTRVARILDDENEPSKMLKEAADEIERLRNRIALSAEMLRIKDELIERQTRRILHLEGVRG